MSGKTVPRKVDSMVADETFSRVRGFHEPRGSRSCGPAQRLTATNRGRPQADRREPEQAWIQAKSQRQEAFRFGPRGKVLVEIRFFPTLPVTSAKVKRFPITRDASSRKRSLSVMSFRFLKRNACSST